MLERTRLVVLAVLIGAAAVGFFAVGGTLYKTAIDLDAPAFPAGAAIQAAADDLGIDIGRSVAGPFWAIAALSF